MAKTKRELLAGMARLKACEAAIEWVTAHTSDDAGEIWRSCENVSWLIWYAGRCSPTAIAAFARRCADRAEAYAVGAGYGATLAVRAAVSAATRAAFCAEYSDAVYAAIEAGTAANAHWDAAYHTAGAGAHDTAGARVRTLQLTDLHNMWDSIQEKV